MMDYGSDAKNVNFYVWFIKSDADLLQIENLINFELFIA